MTQFLHLAFPACLPISLVLLASGHWVWGLAVALVGTPLLWALRNLAAERARARLGPLGHPSSRAMESEWLATQRAQRRFRLQASSPVSVWRDCPTCGGPITSRSKHAAGCSTCLRAYSDSAWEPVVSEWPESYGSVVGERKWLPLLESDLALRSLTKAWVVRPCYVPVGPMVILDERLMCTPDS